MAERVIFLTECGSGIGFGHLTRCGAIAAACRAKGVAVELWVETDEPAHLRTIADARPVNWSASGAAEARALAAASAVFVDSLRAGPAQLEHLGGIAPHLVILDDWLRRPHRRGTVVDWTIGAERFAYPRRQRGVRYLLGSTYCALRPEFGAPPERKAAGEPRSVLVTFGGSDPRGLTAPVLAMLRDRFPGLHRHVVIGGGVRDRGLLAAAGDAMTTIHCDCSAAQMRALMAGADAAVGAGGQTLYELAAMGLPPVVVRIVDNQTDDIREFTAAGFARFAGDWDAPDLPERIAAGLEALHPAAARRRSAERGRELVDGRGAQRLVRACLERETMSPQLPAATPALSFSP